MTYNADLTWLDLSRIISSKSSSLVSTLVLGKEAYNAWQSFRAGRTDAAIATALGRAEVDVAAMDAAFAALVKIHDFGDNQVPVRADHFFSLRKFS